jgi:hypothetical protein
MRTKAVTMVTKGDRHAPVLMPGKLEYKKIASI